MEAASQSGAVAALRFEVIADSDQAANAAAQTALTRLAPGWQALHPADGLVTAQWLPWSWQWAPSEFPVRVAYNPSGAPASVGPDAVLAGLQAWSGVATSAFRFQYAGITDNSATILDFGPDGENVVSWRSLDCLQSCVLGITTKQEAHEVDMLLNSNPAAAEQLGVGTAVDWKTVILHELGHMAGLEHSCPVPFGPCTAAEADAVMFYQYRGTLRVLAPDDIAGISTLYPAVSSPTPTPPVPSPTPTPYPEFPVFLSPGWNLSVLPPLSITQLSGGLPCLDAVYRFESGEWRSWIRGAPPVIQEISEVGGAAPYWLLASGPCGRDFP